MNQSQANSEKILLALLPFWTPLIPPLGISCLKSVLHANGFQAKIMDANVEQPFKEIHQRYFQVLKKSIPGDKMGNFFNIGQDVMNNHLMAHINYTDEKEYRQLLKYLVHATFFCDVTDDRVDELIEIIREFYRRMENYLLGWLDREQPDWLGLSVFNGTLPASMWAAGIVRQRFPHIKIVMGGPVFSNQLALNTPNMKRFLEKTKDYIDKIIIGEGELLLLKLLRGHLPREQRVYTLADINGEVLDLSQAGIPDFSDLELDLYSFASAYGSRSCPFQCSFCSETLYWGKYRRKSPPRIVEELRTLSDTTKRRLFLLGDCLLNPIVTAISQEFIKSPLSLYWDGYLRAEKPVCDLNNTFMWRQGGFYRARLGLESGSPRMLQVMNKKITRQQIKDALYSLASAGIKTTTYWVVGHPGETEEDFQQTLDLIRELKEFIYEAECNPFRFYYSGQVHSGEWARDSKIRLLYPETASDMLVTQTWFLEGEPTREEIYRRVSRFTQHCSQLGIPNPYTLMETFQADERWKSIHKNAVPSVAELADGSYPANECKKIKNVNLAERKYHHDNDWGF